MMRGYLLDVNVLLALAWPNHTQHRLAHEWFERNHAQGWGTCMVTQLGFVRNSSHPSMPHHVTTQEALHKLRQIIALPTHSFWPDPENGYADEAFERTLSSTLTHGLVTEGYLCGLAAKHDGQLATFDRQCARTFTEMAEWIGSGKREV